jgi:hypothetical protein
VIHSTECGAQIWRRSSVCPAVLFSFLLLVAAAAAQKPPDPSAPLKYDLHAETKIKGIVDEVKIPPKGSEKEAVHLTLKSGADTINVFLSPKPFLDDMGMDFSKGDELSISGSKIKQGDADLILAREVVKGNNTFVFRDDKGTPVWSWHR